MATFPIAPTSGEFHSAISSYHLACRMRGAGMSDADTSTVESIIGPLFDAALAAPARSLREAVAKGDALLAEYGDADIVPTEFVRALVEDLRRLEQ